MKGYLVVRVFADTIAQPVSGATVEITGENIDIKTTTNISGTTETIELPAPDISNSENPQSEIRPYSTYNVKVTNFGLTPSIIKDVEIFPTITSFQDVFLQEKSDLEEQETIISDNTLWGDYPPKVPEEPEKQMPTRPTLFVLPRVIVPEYVIVHDGLPTSTSAPNYVVPFSDYIKNVASSEIYATWPRETIKANVIAIISFTLNRVFTEWYRSKGYDFTITSTPQYDQKWTKNRTIFSSISEVVDEVFNQYIRANENVIQPLLAQYSDGIKVIKNGWLSQWGSKTLGDQGYTAEQILKYYYGNSIVLNEAPIYLGLPTSFPGYNLKLDSCGEAVQFMQNQLNKITGSYPGIPKIPNANGIFDSNTRKTVETFQKVFNLPVTGIVDFSTWYKISYIYIAVSKMISGVVG